MDKNLDSYIKIYKGMIPETVCQQTILSLSQADWRVHAYLNMQNEYVSHDDELHTTMDDCPTRNEIMRIFWDAINKYVNEDMKFSWFGGWSGYSSVRFNKYDVNTQMRKHCDHIHDLFVGEIRGIPTLTVLAALNNEYEGGELVFFDDTQIRLEAGDIMVFPSNFLYPHKVQKITDGTRYSCVSWVY